MTDEPRIPRTPSPRWRRTASILVTASLTVAACGSDNQETAAETSVVTQVDTGPGDIQYGASVEEWEEAANVGTDTTVEPGPEAEAATDSSEGYEELDWEDLLPPGFSSDDVFAKYEDRLAALEDGSPEADAIYAEMQAEYDANADSINRELDGTKVYLAGFVAPLNFEDDIVTEFLLVPYFGACIHVPAPPPNQTVLVTVDKAAGLSIDDTWGPVWVAGTLTVDPTTTDLATASYTMPDSVSGVYNDYG